jgi:hypothetical protein
VTALDVADLVVIGGRVLGIGTGAALKQVDAQAAGTALAEAPVPPSLPDSYVAATACANLISGLMQHPPFPEHRERVAVAVGLQFLAVNGWQANLNPPHVAAIVVQCLASGRIEPDDMAGWLAARLTAPAARGSRRPNIRNPKVRNPNIRNKESLVRLPLQGQARRARSGAGISIDGRMLARFSDHAAATVFMARQEARRLGHGSVDPEHLLLGLIRVGEGTGISALPEALAQGTTTSAPHTCCSPSTTTTDPLPGRWPALGLPRAGSATRSRHCRRTHARAHDSGAATWQGSPTTTRLLPLTRRSVRFRETASGNGETRSAVTCARRPG